MNQNILELKEKNLELREQLLEKNEKILELNKKLFEFQNTKVKKISVEKKKDVYEELVNFRTRLNKKENLKEKILTLINGTGTYLAEIQFLFVEQNKFTSKATFYNYLKELEFENQIETKRIKNKSVVFLKKEKILIE